MPLKNIFADKATIAPVARGMAINETSRWVGACCPHVTRQNFTDVVAAPSCMMMRRLSVGAGLEIMSVAWKYWVYCLAVGLFLPFSCALAADLPMHEAPFGLRFGMKPEEVLLPKANPPEPPKRSPGDWGYKSDRERVEELKHESLLAGCEATFDRLLTSNLQNRTWVGQFHQHARDEIFDMVATDVLSKDDESRFCRLKERPALTEPTLRPKVALHVVEAAGRSRPICLIFTDRGLAHIYIARTHFEDIIEDIYKRLDANASYQKFTSRSVPGGRASAVIGIPQGRGDGCAPPSGDEVAKEIVDRMMQRGGTITNEDRQKSADIRLIDQTNDITRWRSGSGLVVVQRRVWANLAKRIFVSAKSIEYDDSLGTRITGMLLEKDAYDDGLIPYLAYTDLARRAKTIESFREIVHRRLVELLPKAAQAEAEVQRQKDDAQRAKVISRKGLVDTFK